MSDPITMSPPALDDFGRPVLAEQMKARINAEFATIAPGKRGALVILVDESGVARGHLAARLGKTGDWKVAAGIGFAIKERKPVGFVGLVGAW